MEVEVVIAEFMTSAAGPSGWPAAGPPEIAFAGRSNVGKSSTINALCARRGLALVSGTPGKTRLLNFFRVVPKDGPELRFVDLPGYGYAKVNKAERAAFQALVEPYVHQRATLAGVVALCDPRREPGAEERDLLEWLEAAGRPALVVATKVDKLARHERKPTLERLRASLKLRRAPIGLSATTREGLEELWAQLLALAAAVRQGPAGEPV
jgi:GTP-binding protein